MRNILLVAQREFKQIAATRGFWVMLMVLPVVIGLTQVGGRFFRPQLNSAYVLVDAAGGFAEAIDTRINLNWRRSELVDISTYAERWGAGKARPDAVWAKGKRWFTDAEVEDFEAAGGVDAALRDIEPALPKDAPRFEKDKQTYLRAATPPGLTGALNAARVGEALAPYLKDVIATPDGERPLALGVFIPADVGPDRPIHVWTNGAPSAYLLDLVKSEATRVLRTRALEASGLPPESAAGLINLSVPLDLIAPPQGAGREQVIVKSALPLAMVYLLMVTVMVTGSMMLQGVIEERSNKLLESVLACVRPGELMAGKLLGLGAVGLTILAVWVGAAVGASLFVQGLVADIVKPSLAAIEPWMVLAMAYYFLAGYLIISMLYLAIGALSNSLQDAQSYLMPVVFLIMLPTVFMMVSTLSDPNSTFAAVLSWIPLYTPFAMLARLGAGVSLFEVLATGAMLALFVVVELYLLGRVFQASLLRTGQPPKLSGFVAMMFGRNTG